MMKIQDKVIDMYNQIPYPDYGDKALTKDYVTSKEYIDLVLSFKGKNSNVYKDKAVLEGGCGTGRESMYLASKGAKLTSIDLTDKSIETAMIQAKQYSFKHKIKFKKASVLELPFKDNSFDIVLSSGVAHHTNDPERAFSELARTLKPNGYMIFYVYNNFAHVVSNFRRRIVFLFAGDDIHKRVIIAKRLFPFYTRKQPLATTYDEFAHPHKSEHSISEIINWFNKYNIEYESVYPKLGFKGAYLTRKYQKDFFRKGRFKAVPQKFNKISFMNKFTSSFFQFLYGFKAYSGGYRFVGIKKD